MSVLFVSNGADAQPRVAESDFERGFAQNHRYLYAQSV